MTEWLEVIKNPNVMVPTIASGVFTLAGVFLGAFLASKSALESINKQMNYDRKKLEELELDVYKRSKKTVKFYTYKILSAATSITRALKENIDGPLSKDSTNYLDNQFEIESIYKDLKAYYKHIENIPENTILTEEFERFLELKSYIDNLIYFLGRYIEEDADTLSPFITYLNSLEESYKKYKE